MYITMVKKVKTDGSSCRKCAEVEMRLEQSGLLHKIDQVIIADERDPGSEGMQLARKHQVELAPFFIVKNNDGTEIIYTVYFRFVKEILQKNIPDSEEIAELMDRNPDLDYI